jgi:hypothetical protein
MQMEVDQALLPLRQHLLTPVQLSQLQQIHIPEVVIHSPVGQMEQIHTLLVQHIHVLDLSLPM